VSGPCRLAFQVAVARDSRSTVDVVESLELTLAEEPVEAHELSACVGGRVHVVASGAGHLVVSYAATLTGLAEPVAAGELELLTYLQPSRYCESDRLGALAVTEFGGLEGKELLDGVSSWVGGHLTYMAGSSLPTDGAVETLLAGRGVCRDYAHLTVALLRGLEVPARVVSVYAPGLAPMDFHAVTEAYIEAAWQVVDPTLLAPREAMVRIATGRDAASTAFLSNYGADVELESLQVHASSDGDLPADDLDELITLH
jgi:transglutaminase-like putative cysteine protease